MPVFGSVADGMRSTGADVSVVFVPPAFAKAAVIEAADAGIGLVVVITEGIPVHDSVAFTAYAASKGTRVIGPNCPGLITPGQANAGIIPADITKPGRIGLVSKSGTLTYQLMYELRDIGFSTCVGIGGDPVVGTSHIDCLAAFQDDPDTELVVLIGRSAATPRNAPPPTSATTSPSRSSATSPASPRPRAGRWATPARSCPAPPARRRRRRRRWRP